MNFTPFTVGDTNIFPIVNSSAGGQLCTEFNLRSRETIYADSSIEYSVGPSFTHSLRDFQVSLALGSSSAIIISAGRALVNGHYIESLVPIQIDIVAENAAATESNRIPNGRVCVGLRVMYSTAATTAGTMLQENNEGVYRGIRVVILPASKFFTPLTKPRSQSQVTADLLLAEFTYQDGVISNLVDNTARVQAFSADRISSIDALISNEFIKRTGLNYKQLYVLSGKGDDGDGGMDWCAAASSLMIWDSVSELATAPGSILPELAPEAQFQFNRVTDETQLVIPHKQPDSRITDGAGHRQYYPDKILKLPNASFANNRGGVVSKAYNDYILKIRNDVDKLKQLPNGKMLQFIDVLEARENLPSISLFDDPDIGDYIIVGQDQTTGATSGNYPITLYMVISEDTGLQRNYTYSSVQPDTARSVQFGEDISTISLPDYDITAPGSSESIEAVKSYCINTPVPGVFGNNFVTVEFTASSDQISTTLITDGGSQAPTINGQVIPITDLTDRQIVCYLDDCFMWNTATMSWQHVQPHAFYLIDPVQQKTWSEPLIMSATVALATTTSVGGFLNVTEDNLGYGYVYLDEDGHLRMLDYELLSAGVLAYQLGDDYKTSEGADIDTINTQLEQYVNQRVAFPSAAHVATATEPSVITVTVSLPETVEANSNIVIYGIDSRFNTSVTIQFEGTSSENLTISIADCEKIRLVVPTGFKPKLNLYRCGLYYDASIIDMLNEVEGFKLWYDKFSNNSANIAVDGMTVYRTTNPSTIQNQTYWSGEQAGDVHYKYALASITFGSDASIIGCELLVTDNINAAPSPVTPTNPVTLVSTYQFTLPVDPDFLYPATKLTQQLKISGQFITSFASSASTTNYIMKNTSFTAQSQYTYNKTDYPGMIAFHTVVSEVTYITGVTQHANVDAWETGEFYKFAGGVASWPSF